MGKIDKSDSVMSAIRKMKPYHQAYYYQRAKLYAVQGKVDSCLKDLERSIQRYEIEAVAMKVDLEFIPLHLHPKYLKFCEVLGFNKYTPWPGSIFPQKSICKLFGSVS